MYRPDEMAMILEQAKQYTDKQRLAYTEKKVLTYDGNPDDRIEAAPGIYFAKVSDEHVDLSTVTKIHIYNIDNGQIEEVEVDKTNERFMWFEEGDIKGFGYSWETGSVTLVDSYQDGMIGTYVAITENSTQSPFNGYISYAEYETIHPIPKEYIPPLDRLILNGTDGKQYALSVDSSGQLVVEEVTA